MRKKSGHTANAAAELPLRSSLARSITELNASAVGNLLTFKDALSGPGGFCTLLGAVDCKASPFILTDRTC